MSKKIMVIGKRSGGAEVVIDNVAAELTVDEAVALWTMVTDLVGDFGGLYDLMPQLRGVVDGLKAELGVARKTVGAEGGLQ